MNASQVRAELGRQAALFPALPTSDPAQEAAYRRTESLYVFIVGQLERFWNKVPGVDTSALLDWMERGPARTRERIWRKLGQTGPYLPTHLVLYRMASALRQREPSLAQRAFHARLAADWNDQVQVPLDEQVLRISIKHVLERARTVAPLWPGASTGRTRGPVGRADLGWLDTLRAEDPAAHGAVLGSGPGNWMRLLDVWEVGAGDRGAVTAWLDRYARDGADGYALLSQRATNPEGDLEGVARRQGFEPTKGSGGRVPASALGGELPAELETPAQRTKANLAAMAIAASKRPSEMTAGDRAILRRYSGWGGLSIERVKDQFPTGFPVPEERGLIHEFYTPAKVCAAVADLVAPRLDSLREGDVVTALEPSAGIGRFILAMSDPRFAALRWHAVEYSELSGRMLAAMAPDLAVYVGPFERWVREQEEMLRGRLRLVVSNPPYGQRGASVTEDPNRQYREKNAYAYFLRRGLDLLGPGGLGIFLIPAGFLHGVAPKMAKLRETVLLRHHLAAAFRLPSDTFPGAHLVTDLLVFRARGGTLHEVLPEDRFILEGRYFKSHPEHILGREIGRDTEGEDDQTKKPRFGYQVEGTFEGFPAFNERPFCSTCAILSDPPPLAVQGAGKTRVGVIVSAADDLASEELTAEYALGAQLGVRVDHYLTMIARSDSPEPAQLWPELFAALTTWRTRYGQPWAHKGLVEVATKKNHRPLQRFLAAWDKGTGTLIGALARQPSYEPRYAGGSSDIVGQATHLFRTRRQLELDELHQWHLGRGGTMSPRAIREALIAAGWALDGAGSTKVMPGEDYYSGNLWEKYDRVVGSKDPVAAVQARRLLEAIKPALFDEIEDISPRYGWMPLPTIQAWMNAAAQKSHPDLFLERAEGLIQVSGVPYAQIRDSSRVSGTSRLILGWLNHDYVEFMPPKQSREDDIDQVRLEYARLFVESFRKWIADQPEHKQAAEHAYNRQFRGWVQPSYAMEPLPIARWVRGGVALKPHQVAGARRVLNHRSGLLAFDVGVGKTYTGIGIVAAARQEGWVKRPVVLVPNSIVWKWAADFKRVLPDYRVCIIGSVRKSRGVNKGKVTSELDTPAERAEKWTAFQAGEYDVCLLTYTALPRTRLREESVREYADHTESIQREVALRKRNASKKAKGKGKLTEREDAILKEGVSAWVAEQMELPEAMDYDPGIVWDDIGIDMVVVDEAQNFKNLYLPEAREGGVPKYMGSEGEGSKRAWQLDFRLAAVRRKTGGSGVVLLSATPAKNSPLEFYNLLQFIDHELWKRIGIRNSEQFIDVFCRIAFKSVLTPEGRYATQSACVGFKNLDVLRDVIFRYGDFKTAEDVGLKLPEPRVNQVWVAMDAEQMAKTSDYQEEIKDLKKRAAKDPGAKFAILGLMARLALVAVAGPLDDGPDWKTALEDRFANFRTAPKLQALAQRVLSNRVCGHIVFCDNLAVHRWVVEVLAGAGIPRERIAVLNGVTAKNLSERTRLAEAFNGNEEDGIPPAYDVIIANAVAYEGIDLQSRTCAIHHLDLPWEPATLQQRNGRGVRQGNKLSAIEINYYLSRQSFDAVRFAMITGKHGWMVSLLKSMDRDTNNPAAQQDLDEDAIRIMLSSDPDAERAAIDAQKAAAERLAVERRKKDASALLVSLNARFRRLESQPGGDEAESLRAQAEEKFRYLSVYDADIWPWARWLPAVRTGPVLVPPAGQMFGYPGLRVRISEASPATKDVPRPLLPGDFIECGAIIGGDSIGIRLGRDGKWTQWPVDLFAMLQIEASDIDPDDWPADDLDKGVKMLLEGDIQEVMGWTGDWPKLRWSLALDAWKVAVWPRVAAYIVDQLAGVSPYYAERSNRVPVVRGDQLLILYGREIQRGEVLAPTEAGFQRFLALGRKNRDLRWTDLNRVAEWWWGRRMPMGGNREGGEETISEGLPALPDRLAKPRTKDAPEPKTTKKARPDVRTVKAIRTRTVDGRTGQFTDEGILPVGSVIQGRDLSSIGDAIRDGYPGCTMRVKFNNGTFWQSADLADWKRALGDNYPKASRKSRS